MISPFTYKLNEYKILLFNQHFRLMAQGLVWAKSDCFSCFIVRKGKFGRKGRLERGNVGSELRMLAEKKLEMQKRHIVDLNNSLPCK